MSGFEDNGINTHVLFLHPVPVCMQFYTFCHPFPPAHNGLLFRITKRVLTCAQDGLRDALRAAERREDWRKVDDKASKAPQRIRNLRDR